MFYFLIMQADVKMGSCDSSLKLMEKKEGDIREGISSQEILAEKALQAPSSPFPSRHTAGLSSTMPITSQDEEGKPFLSSGCLESNITVLKGRGRIRAQGSQLKLSMLPRKER